jgi:polysaccharide export outer membrane protein
MSHQNAIQRTSEKLDPNGGNRLSFAGRAFRLLMMAGFLCVAFTSYASAAPPSKGGSPEYQIGPEDVLTISVWKEPDLQKEVLVRPDGGISFPLAGDIHAAGMTAAQLEQEISKRIQKYIPAPVVTVSVTKVAGYKVYVLGKVNKPGEYVVGRYVDVMQALTLAGGLTPYASENNIKIIRKVNGRDKVFPFRYSDVQDGERLEQNIQLKSGDTVVVP